jgi:hypothetical protein
MHYATNTTSLLRRLFPAVALLALGCLPASNTASDAGATDTHAPDAADAADASPSDTGAADRVEAAPTVTYTKDVQPIFQAKCSPCHSELDLGRHNIATTYADALHDIESVDSYGCWNDSDPNMFTMPKRVGECALILIMNGRMPSGAGCGGSMPEDPSKCLSAEQKALVAAWVAAGMPQ